MENDRSITGLTEIFKENPEKIDIYMKRYIIADLVCLIQI